MIYLYYLVIAVGGALPAAIPLTFVGAVFIQQTSSFWLNRPLGQPRRAGRPPVAPTGPAYAHDVHLRRWNIAAGVVVVSPAVVATVSYLVAENEITGCVPNELYGCFATGASTELMLVLLLASIPFATAASCVLMLFGLVATAMSEPLLLVADAILSASVFGYGIYLMERKWVRETESNPQRHHASRVNLQLAATALIVGLVSLSAIRYGIVATGQNTEASLDGSETAWMSLIILAVIAAAALAITTSLRRLTESRPFLLGLTWPALLLLAAGADRLGTDELGWTERLLGGTLTVLLLWAMWYVFGPGRRATAQIESKERGLT